MKISLAFSCLPILFLAGAAVGACSSSSHSTTGPVDGSAGAGSDSGESSSASQSGSTGVSESSRASASTGESGSGSGSGSSAPCAPDLPAGFAPLVKTYGPATTCTSATLTAVVDACFGSGATEASCNAAGELAANEKCFQCFFSQSTNANWAPILFINDPPNSPKYPYSNPAGCVAAEDPVGGRPCQVALDARTQCEIAACVRTCPATDAGTPALVGTFDTSGNLATPGCLENASNGPTCQSFVDNAKTACASETKVDGTGALDKCNALAKFQSAADIRSYFGVVCGGLESGSGGGDAGH